MSAHVDLTPRPWPPRAPSQFAWDAMTPAERKAVVASLPAAMTEAECTPSEGDAHFDAKTEGRDTLRTYFERTGRRIYVASELTVYYPDEPRFSPDLLAVRDVDLRPRTRWVTSDEGKGLDWVLEVLVSGDRRKDLERNVVRYARLLIPEYFVFDRGRNALRGWRLADPKVGIYQPMVPQRGAFHSEVLDLDLQVDRGRLRFKQGSALVLAPGELILRLEQEVTDLVMGREQEGFLRAEAERQVEQERLRAAEAERGAEQEVDRERKRADEAERKLEEALRELERLRGSRDPSG